jgi:hypothetical protein
MRDIAALTAADFEAAVGSDFEITGEPDAARGEGEPIVVRLTKVVLLQERPGYRRPFSLEFRGPRSPALGPVTHGLAHPDMGRLEIFLSPVSADPDGTTYEAVFS